MRRRSEGEELQVMRGDSPLPFPRTPSGIIPLHMPGSGESRIPPSSFRCDSDNQEDSIYSLLIHFSCFLYFHPYLQTYLSAIHSTHQVRGLSIHTPPPRTVPQAGWSLVAPLLTNEAKLLLTNGDKPPTEGNHRR